MFYRRLLTGASILGLVVCTTTGVSAQTTTNNIDAPNNATSTANPVNDLNQNGSLVNTQVNTFPLGRSVVGNGVADCSSDGIAFSAFGNGIGPFDSGSLGGSFTYTHSFGVDTCRSYAKTQLARSKLETCLLLISNYSKMTKAGVRVSYEALKQIAGVECPAISVPKPGLNPFGAAPTNRLNANQRHPRQLRPNAAAAPPQGRQVSVQQQRPQQQPQVLPVPYAPTNGQERLAQPLPLQQQGQHNQGSQVRAWQ